MSAAVAVRLALPEGPALRRALSLAHVAAAALALVACGVSPAGVLLVMSILVHLYHVQRQRRALADALVAVLLDSAGVWYLQWRDGTRERARLAPGPMISPWLTILTLDGPRGRQGVFITPDMLDADSFRRLRMRLLWQGATP